MYLLQRVGGTELINFMMNLNMSAQADQTDERIRAGDKQSGTYLVENPQFVIPGTVAFDHR